MVFPSGDTIRSSPRSAFSSSIRLPANSMPAFSFSENSLFDIISYWLIYDFVASVVSMENELFRLNSSSIRLSIKRPASIATLSGLNGDNPRAISSALTNSLQSNISGKTVYEAVVFPAPLQPLMIYRFLAISAANLYKTFRTAKKNGVKMHKPSLFSLLSIWYWCILNKRVSKHKISL